MQQNAIAPSIPTSREGTPTLDAAPRPSNTRLDKKSIRRIRHWGGGASSEVWEAIMSWNGTTRRVALKVLRHTNSQERLHKREERERTWRSLEHENILPLLDIYHQPDGLPVFVSPWYENGTVDVYLRQHPAVNPIDIIFEIASAVEYLHGVGVVHGDLKATNILIDDNGHARLIDFGLSRLMNATLSLDTNTTTTLRWCAPELLDDPLPTMPSDVYAFASTILELLTGKAPYSELVNDVTVFVQVYNHVNPRHLTGGFRYDVPHAQELWELLEQCWAGPSIRPSIRDVRLRLSSLYR